MKYSIVVIKSILLPAALLLAGGCIHELDRPLEQEGLISFAVSDGNSTKGSSVTASNIAALYGNDGNVAVSAYCDGASYFNEGEQLFAGESGWRAGGIYYWPEDESLALDFWSWAPMSFPDGCGELSVNQPLSQVLSFRYVMPEPAADHNDAKRQKDLVMGAELSVRRSSHSGQVEMAYRHALTAVKINVAKSNGGILKSISLENVRTAGDCKFDPQTYPYFMWENLSGEAVYTQNFGKEVTENLDGNDRQHISSGIEAEADGTIFMLIPQSCQDIRLKVVFRMAGKTEDDVFETELSGEWKAGESYTYTLNLLDGLGIMVDVSCDGKTIGGLKMQNVARESCFIRATVVGNVLDGEGNIVAPWDPSPYILENQSNWGDYWSYDAQEDIYYYKYPLASGEQPAVSLFDSLTAPDCPSGTRFVMSVIIQALKSEEGRPSFWESINN